MESAISLLVTGFWLPGPLLLNHFFQNMRMSRDVCASQYTNKLVLSNWPWSGQTRSRWGPAKGWQPLYSPGPVSNEDSREESS